MKANLLKEKEVLKELVLRLATIFGVAVPSDTTGLSCDTIYELRRNIGDLPGIEVGVDSNGKARIRVAPNSFRDLHKTFLENKKEGIPYDRAIAYIQERRLQEIAKTEKASLAATTVEMIAPIAELLNQKYANRSYGTEVRATGNGLTIRVSESKLTADQAKELVELLISGEIRFELSVKDAVLDYDRAEKILSLLSAK